MIKISVQQVCLMQQQIIAFSGGLQGVRDFGLVQSSIEGAYVTFDLVDLYPTIEDKAAFMCFSLIKNHGFVDGNKRIGVNVLQIFLSVNGVFLNVSDDDLVELGLGVANSDFSLEDVKVWIEKHKI